MHRNDGMTITVINPVYNRIAELEPFNYKQRIKYIKASFPMAAAYLQTGNWDENVQMQLKTGGILRELGMKKLVDIFDREH